jgi:hypothetical protein
MVRPNEERVGLPSDKTRLTWPILIAGFELPKGEPTRKVAVGLLGEFE